MMAEIWRRTVVVLIPARRAIAFRARMGRAGTQMLVELTEFDRPHRLGSRTTSSMMQTSGALTFAADGDGTAMSWDWQVHPRAGCESSASCSGPWAAAWNAESQPA
jgi:hypothetical protein